MDGGQGADGLDANQASQQVLQAFAAVLATQSGPGGVLGADGSLALHQHNPLANAGQQAQQAAAPAQPAAKNGKNKLPRPDTIEPCPRCGSNDTKFCYYNNYNVKQPRFFCKSCQRYWTAGGTLRNVPPGSGRRKSKSQSKSDSQGEKPAPTSSGSLADQLAKQTAASALLSNPAQLAASVPFLNPMLAESTLLAYNAAAQQSLLGALAAKMPVAGSQWPSGLNGNGAVADTAASLASPSANGGTSSNHGLQMPNGAGDDLHDSEQPAKRVKLEGAVGGSDSDALQATHASPPAMPQATTPTPAAQAPVLDETAHTPPNGMINMVQNGMGSNGSNGNMMMGAGQSGIPSWPGMGGADQSYMNGMAGAQGDSQNVMGNKSGSQAAAAVAQNAAVAAQSAYQQQQMAYQHLMQAQLMHQHLAAQQQVAQAAGLAGQTSPYLLPHLAAAFNPYKYAAAAANPSLSNLGYNPAAGR